MNDSVGLFSIETNCEPAYVRVARERIPSKVIQVFGLPESIEVAELTKGNPFSRLFEYRTCAGIFIIRKDFSGKRQQLEIQSSILSELSVGLSIRPLRHAENGFVWGDGKECWLCYPKLPGHQYDGNPAKLSALLCRAIKLHRELGSIATHKQLTQLLPKCSYVPSDWHKIWNWLFDLPKNGFQERLQQVIPLPLKSFFVSGESDFNKSVSESITLPMEERLVHYDLQHANILISDTGDIFFIDPEDIYWSDMRLAIVHGIFKWVRHSIYVDMEHRASVIDWLRNDCIKILEAGLNEPFGMESFRHYSQFRTLSDLYNLCNAVINNGQVELLYDLEKKIHNLLEIRSIFK